MSKSGRQGDGTQPAVTHQEVLTYRTKMDLGVRVFQKLIHCETKNKKQKRGYRINTRWLINSTASNTFTIFCHVSFFFYKEQTQ